MRIKRRMTDAIIEGGRKVMKSGLDFETDMTTCPVDPSNTWKVTLNRAYTFNAIF